MRADDLAGLTDRSEEFGCYRAISLKTRCPADLNAIRMLRQQLGWGTPHWRIATHQGWWARTSRVTTSTASHATFRLHFHLGWENGDSPTGERCYYARQVQQSVVFRHVSPSQRGQTLSPRKWPGTPLLRVRPIGVLLALPALFAYDGPAPERRRNSGNSFAARADSWRPWWCCIYLATSRKRFIASQR